MPRQLTISMMLGLVAACGVAFAALRSPNGYWLLLSYLTSFSILMVATLRAWIDRGPRRPIWLGAAIFGWGFYMVTGQAPISSQSNALSSGYRDVFDRLHPPPPLLTAPPYQNTVAYQAWQVATEKRSSARSSLSYRFEGIFNSLILLPLVVAGGYAGRALSLKMQATLPPSDPAVHTEAKEAP